MSYGLSNIVVPNSPNYKLTDMWGLNRLGLRPPSTSGETRAILNLFPQLRRQQVPCNIPAEMSFLRYAAMTLGSAVDCRYPLPNEIPIEGPYARVDCEEPLP